jgi:hypothetical protein
MVRQIESLGETVIVANNGYLVASNSQPGFWHCLRRVDGELRCDCLGYQHSKTRTCRHLRAVAALAERPAPTEPNGTFALVERMMAGEFRAK